MNILQYTHGQKVIKKSSGAEMVVDRYEGSKIVCVYLDPSSGNATGYPLELDEIEPFAEDRV
ncbi:hypothetical protein [Leptospira noguchii]|uniref:hypothetical protein n=1 Tax=Leptospira noguchii TaxID=28182 RepID=UPI0002DDA1DE|nr:hypothetical protein [Leptospira noguchii]